MNLQIRLKARGILGKVLEVEKARLNLALIESIDFYKNNKTVNKIGDANQVRIVIRNIYHPFGKSSSRFNVSDFCSFCSTAGSLQKYMVGKPVIVCYEDYKLSSIIPFNDNMKIKVDR